ncbi:MAG: hypothetical protein K2H70_02910, partial [Bacteroidales bacterium]|nr:hypothetical protein [Bacteroidales bacterium]
MRTEGRNGKTFKVFVKNPPLPPLLYDPVTAQSVRFQYTDLRWKQLMEKNPDLKDQDESAAERFFVCNHTPVQDQNWITSNQRFGLYVKGDSIFNRDPLKADFSLVDYDGYFQELKKIQAEFEPRTSGTAYKKDSSWVQIRIREANRPAFEDVQQIKVGFYANNACGPGDTAIYRSRILDTLTTIDLFSNTRVDGWDTLCEGMALELESTSNDFYFKLSDRQNASDWSRVETDRVDYAWKAPAADWTFTTDTNAKTVRLKVGATGGPVGLRLGNRCGYGSYLDSAIFVHPFVRVTMVGDTTPCRGAEVTYRFKQADFAEGYRVTWPGDDWVERSSQVRNDSMVYTVVVGDKEEGPIYIVGQKTKAPGLKPIPMNETEQNFGCNFQFDNYPSHNRDSLKVRVKH